MRVTAETKAATREAILKAARRLIAADGFAGCTTRQIADASGIASGTLFNYFATKEAVLASLAAEAVADVHQVEETATSEDGSLEEQLFGFVMTGLRKLKPLRKHLAVLVETVLSPLSDATGGEIRALRLSHLETVARLARQHGIGELPSVALQLYWTLYTGVLMFWTADQSPKQEDTLALLDESLAMFVGWLQRDGGLSPAKGGAEPCPRR
ncbi:MAG TPA: TetR/AcrR family transcriptional regulator [Gemmataceae bacterium]|jgi:AcrR family transcriptional regulator|nr:TetR/AcrR family transcriptional regulator [Gemmataceae bacterium]